MVPRFTNNRAALATVVLTAAALLLMTFDIRSSSRGVGGTMRDGLQTVLSPIQSAVNAVVDPVLDFAGGLANLAGLRSENQRLRERIVELERETAQASHLRSRASELEALLGLQLSDGLQETAVSAEITGRAGALDRSYIIDKGTRDGVQEGQPVVDAQGALLGVVAEVSEAGAAVIPLTSRRAPGITVRLSDGRRGVVEGQGAGRLLLSVLNASAPVWAGDYLETFGPYGASDSYPKGLAVGTVRESASPRSGAIQVPVDPLVDLERTEFVAVIPWPPSPDQLEESLGAASPPEDAAVPESEGGEPAAGESGGGAGQEGEGP